MLRAFVQCQYFRPSLYKLWHIRRETFPNGGRTQRSIFIFFVVSIRSIAYFNMNPSRMHSDNNKIQLETFFLAYFENQTDGSHKIALL